MQFVIEFEMVFKDPNTATLPRCFQTSLLPRVNEIVRMGGHIFRVSEVIHSIGSDHHVDITLVEQ